MALASHVGGAKTWRRKGPCVPSVRLPTHFGTLWYLASDPSWKPTYHNCARVSGENAGPSVLCQRCCARAGQQQARNVGGAEGYVRLCFVPGSWNQLCGSMNAVLKDIPIPRCWICLRGRTERPGYAVVCIKNLWCMRARIASPRVPSWRKDLVK
jgi:hypothetical protein